MIVDLCLGIVVGMLCLERLGLRHWAFRWPSYFLRQVVVVLIVLLAVKVVWEEHTTSFDYTLVTVAGVAILFGLWRLYHYTSYGPKSVADCVDDSPDFSVLVVNVQCDNPDHDKLTELISRTQPEIIVALEVTSAWEDSIQAACAGYAHSRTVVREDPFGLGIWSQHPILSHEVFTIYNSYPTMHCAMRIQEQLVDLWIMHPIPPAPGDAETSEPKDTEFAVVSRVIEGHKNHTVVVGDLNDVAWSTASRRFLKRSNLRDPRRGRGFINTFPTYAPWLGFPLDQIFVSQHFCIRRLEKLPHIGSDHFPLYAEVVIYDGKENKEARNT